MKPQYKTIMKRTSTYIATIPMKNVEQVIEVKKTLEQIFGWVVLRGRHSDRKKVLGDRWHRSTQNDVPWRKAQRIDIYLHPKNPNYQSVGQCMLHVPYYYFLITMKFIVKLIKQK